mmetsp:Transcript_14876/g.20377  ORF Transcript_14876/g.20377 Transcript_14876/m.20377 type:complete len:125 (-) Transcript_14876:72-446(-)
MLFVLPRMERDFGNSLNVTFEAIVSSTYEFRMKSLILLRKKNRVKEKQHLEGFVEVDPLAALGAAAVMRELEEVEGMVEAEEVEEIVEVEQDEAVGEGVAEEAESPLAEAEDPEGGDDGWEPTT